MFELSLVIWIGVAILLSVILTWVFSSIINASSCNVTDFSFVSYRTLKRLIEDGDLRVDSEGYVYVIDSLASDFKNRWAILMDPITFYWFTFTHENKLNKKLIAPWKRNKEIN